MVLLKKREMPSSDNQKGNTYKKELVGQSRSRLLTKEALFFSKDVKEGDLKAKDLFDSSEEAGAARQDVCVVKESKVAASTPAP